MGARNQKPVTHQGISPSNLALAETGCRGDWRGVVHQAAGPSRSRRGGAEEARARTVC